MKKHLHPHPQGDKGAGEGDLGPWGLATPPLPPSDFLSLAALGPVFDIDGGACWFPFSRASLVLT